MKNVSELLKQYKNPFTLDDQLRPQPGVTEARVKRAQQLIQESKRSRAAEGQLMELFTTSNLGFSIAHLLNIQMIPQLDEELKDLAGLAGERTVRDFNPVVLRSLIASAGVEGAGIGTNGEAAVVPEGTPFPIVTVKSDEESFYQKLAKRGFRFDFTFESVLSDLLGEIEALPAEMLKVTKDTIYAEIFDALEQASRYLESVTLPDGTLTDPNAPVSTEAIIGATVALENRTINGRKIGKVNSVNVVVPTGRERFLEWDLNQYGRIIQVQDGALTLRPDSDIQALLPKINIIESDRVTGSNWFLYPKPGTTPRPVLERLKLRGYENPEIRVRNDQGFHLGGGKVDAFDGGFDADTMSYRYRFITGAALWDDTWVVRSKGDKSPA
ncbi:hypothetical protein [Microbacterium sp.]|uniref:phage major capsid protein n=1 Tax=Microbacterium sp. TaxID=51671 RepID=UPI0039E3250B